MLIYAFASSIAFSSFKQVQMLPRKSELLQYQLRSVKYFRFLLNFTKFSLQSLRNFITRAWKMFPFNNQTFYISCTTADKSLRKICFKFLLFSKPFLLISYTLNYNTSFNYFIEWKTFLNFYSLTLLDQFHLIFSSLYLCFMSKWWKTLFSSTKKLSH